MVDFKWIIYFVSLIICLHYAISNRNDWVELKEANMQWFVIPMCFVPLVNSLMAVIISAIYILAAFTAKVPNDRT